MADVFLIADDLTGAADSGVTFAKAGAEVLVSWEAGRLPDADVVALSSESRHAPAAEAAARVEAVITPLEELLADVHHPWVYKKIDSTLRGHPALELSTLMAKLGGPPCVLVAPAFPAQGRVTREGTHYVHDLPLADTVFGKEVGTSQVRELFMDVVGPERVCALSLSAVRAGDDALAAHIGAMVRLAASSPCVIVADAVTENDLLRLADAALRCGVRTLCGSAGLAEALASKLAVVCGWSERERPIAAARRPAAPPPEGSAVLVVAASRHPQTMRQLEALDEAGFPVVTPHALLGETPAAAGADGNGGFREVGGGEASGQAVLDRAFSAGGLALTTVGLPDMPGQGKPLASCLAETAVALLRSVDASGHRKISGLVLTGGDAAVAVSRALGARALRLRGEVAPGLPWGYLVGGMNDRLPFVTKAGGFGAEDALLGVMRFLKGGAETDP